MGKNNEKSQNRLLSRPPSGRPPLDILGGCWYGSWQDPFRLRMAAMSAFSIVIRSALVTIGVIAWLYSLHGTPIRFGANAVPEEPRLPIIAYGYAITLVGVVFGTVYRELRRRKSGGQEQLEGIKSFLRSILLSIDLYLGLCGSPFVYALLLKSFEGGNIIALTTVALQNGFCCTIILNSLLDKPGTGN
jgi:hypothetical protein